ncbi:MAG TPA: hemolysin family protein [Kineosporiaceae bacterium]|nr:hemolysin family protein [Kineosporiaceae bacterium]
MLGQIALVLAFSAVGGCFAAAEIALVSLRPGQVARLAAGSRRGQAVQRLVQQPNRFLSAGQIGVTLAGFLSSAVGAVTFAAPVAAALRRLHLSAGAADTLAVLLVTIVVAYISLVIGELAPKRIGLQRAESVALVSAGAIEAIARGTRPVIWLLGVSSDLVVRLVGGDPRSGREVMTEQELREIVATNDELTLDERRLIGEVLDAGDRPVREVMIPRLDVNAVQADLTVAAALDAVRDLPNSRYPVVDGGLDDVAGFVHVRDLYAAAEQGRGHLPLRTLVRPVMRIPDSRRALPALVEMRKAGAHLAVVVDEYGGGAGIVTLEDLLEELVGDITDEFDPSLAENRRGGSEDGAPPPLPSEPVDAQLRLEEFEEETGIRLPEGPYDTAAGWMLYALGRIPHEGDQARHGDIVLTVTELRGRRVERVGLSRVVAPTTAAPTAPDSAPGSVDSAPGSATSGATDPATAATGPAGTAAPTASGPGTSQEPEADISSATDMTKRRTGRGRRR